MKKIIIAIDATSIVNTGGFTHLYHLKDSLKKIKQNLNEVRKLKWEETSKKTFNFITNLT